MSKKQRNTNKLPPFVPLLLMTMDSRAWRQMSHGARMLYIALKRRVPGGRNRAFISYRLAMTELKSSQRKIREWFQELEHYGFTVLVQHGSLGVDGRGKSPHWRLTELGQTSRASADALFDPPTMDFLRWDGTLFKKPKKQNPASYGGYAVYPTAEAVVLPTGVTPNSNSVTHGVCIGTSEGVTHGVCITSLTTRESSSGLSLLPPELSANPSVADFGPNDERVAALTRWGSNAAEISEEQKARFEKIRSRFDALVDPRLEAAA